MESEISNKSDKINVYKIIEAGIALKNIVYAILAMIVISVVGVLISLSLNKSGDRTILILLICIVSLGFNFIILKKLYDAGDCLEKVISIDQVSENVQSSKINLIQNKSWLKKFMEFYS
jgi:hypothetical protein